VPTERMVDLQWEIPAYFEYEIAFLKCQYFPKEFYMRVKKYPELSRKGIE
jgi:hypothetical protein